MCVQFAMWGLVGLIQALHFHFFLYWSPQIYSLVRCKDQFSGEEGNKATMYKQTVSGEKGLRLTEPILQHISLRLGREKKRWEEREKDCVHTAAEY